MDFDTYSNVLYQFYIYYIYDTLNFTYNNSQLFQSMAGERQSNFMEIPTSYYRNDHFSISLYVPLKKTLIKRARVKN